MLMLYLHFLPPLSFTQGSPGPAGPKGDKVSGTRSPYQSARIQHFSLMEPLNSRERLGHLDENNKKNNTNAGLLCFIRLFLASKVPVSVTDKTRPVCY